MPNVIRQDIIEVGFDIDLKELTQVNKEIDDMKKGIAGGIGDDAFDGLTDSAKQAQKGADALQGDLKNVSKVSMAKLNLGLGDIEDKLTSIAKKAGTAAYKALKKVAGISFKALSIGIAGAATATAALVGSAVSAYAEYEQLIGGVETLFKGDAGVIEEYANNAYKTAGLSANAYMETVTSFSASLLQSVGGDTAKAAKYANTAITDMSDNANKMGSDMGTIQNAYQGFAKQNYTMLDNLKLGYGGTKEEMQRLLKDAEKISGQKFDLSSYADIVQAIHVVQENMGIAGTTAEEASETISGSFSSMKSAWQNLLPSLLKGGDSFNQCVDNLVSSVKKFAKNIKPAIKKALAGVTDLIKELVPIIAKELPAMIIELAPVLANAGAQIVVGLAKGVANNGDKLITAAKEVVVSVIKAIYEAITGQPMGEEKFNELKRTVDEVFSAIGKIISAVMQVLKALAPVLEFVLNIAVKVFTWIGNNADWLVPIILTLVGAFLLYKGVMAAISAGQRIMAVTSALLGGTLPVVSAGTTAAGTAAGASAVPVSTAATAFMKFGVGVLAAGAGVMFIAAGFWLLAQAAIALSNAGLGAIIVFALLVVAIVALAIVVATCGTAMIAGSVGFLIFGAAVLLVGAGFALLGAGAWLAATALQIIAGALPALVQYGLSGTVSILALSAGLLVFGVSAGVAGLAVGLLAIAMLAAVVAFSVISALLLVIGAALILIGAGLLVAGNGMKLCGEYGKLAAVGISAVAAIMPSLAMKALVGAPALLALGAALLVFGAGALTAGAGVLVLAAGLALLSGALALMAANSVLFKAAVNPLPALFSALAPPVVSFATALTPLTALFAVLGVAALVFTASMAVLMALLVILAPLGLLFSAAMVALAPAFATLKASAPAVSKALKSLPKLFAKLIIPAGLLVAAISPLAKKFLTCATSSLLFLAATAGLVVTTTALAILLQKIVSASSKLVTIFPTLAEASRALASALKPLTVELRNIAKPLTDTATKFALFAVSAIMARGAVSGIVSAFLKMTLVIQSVNNALKQFEKAFGKIAQGGATKMLNSIILTLRKMEFAIRQTNLANAGMQMMNGLILGMNSRRSAAISAARAIAQAINREYRKIQDIHSPSGEWEKYGAYQIQGNINGMENSVPELERTVDKVGEASMPYAGHYTPENSTTYTSSRRAEYNTYSPQFSFSISGTNDDRAITRKVKRAVAEAWSELMSDYEMKIPQTQEV